MRARFFLLFFLLPSALVLTGPARAQTPIVQGVSKVIGSGAIGPVTGIPSFNVRGLVSGDDDTPLPSLVCLLSTLGKGRVLAWGHDSFLMDKANGLFDTRKFNTQAVLWLDAKGTKKLAFLVGHGEGARVSRCRLFVQALKAKGFQVKDIYGQVTSSALSGVGVVVVGNAVKDFTSAELNLLENYVKNGGALFLTGLGWFWEPYHKRPLDQYPMNVLGERFGIRWLGGYVVDPTNKYNGNTVFHTFFPNCDLQLPGGAMARLESILAGHASNLGNYLGSNASVRKDYLTSIASVAAGEAGIPLKNGWRAAFDARLRAFLLKYPRWYGSAWQFDKTRKPWLSLGRAVLHSALAAAFPLDTNRVNTLVQALNFKWTNQDYLDIFTRHKLLLLDNRRLQSDQRRFIKDLLEAAKAVPRTMRRITVKGFLGKTSPDISRAFFGGGVNIFGMSMGPLENGFPKDVRPLRRPVFAIVVVHETAHSFDAAMLKDPLYASLRKRLLRDAGLDDLQYLRSMVGGKFFQKAPQEFVASMANQWVMDSAHTFEVGVTRWLKGKGEPILQCLFMLDLYGQRKATAPLFRTSLKGVLSVVPASLQRDGAGRVTDVTSPEACLHVRYDANSKAAGLAAALRYGDPSPLGVEMRASSAPALGNYAFSLAGKAPAKNAQGFLLLSFKDDDRPSPDPALAGRVYLDLSTALILPLKSDGKGNFTQPLPLPDHPALRNLRLYAQAFFVRPNPSGPDYLGSSPGISLLLGK